MKKLQMIKHHYGFIIQFTEDIVFDMDTTEWRFIPSIELRRRPGVFGDTYSHLPYLLTFAFLCFSLTIYKWEVRGNGR